MEKSIFEQLLTTDWLDVARTNLIEPLLNRWLDPPPYLKNASTNIKILSLERTTFAENSALGNVTDFALMGHGESIAIAGNEGAAQLSKTGQIRSILKYFSEQDDVTLVLPRTQGTSLRYLNSGSWHRFPRLFDATGKSLWSIKNDPGANDTAYGYFGTSESAAFVAGFNGSGGISLFDEAGHQIWNQDDGNVWHVELTSPRTAEPTVIIHSNSRGLLTVRAESGEILRQIKLPVYLSQFCLCRYPTINDNECILACAKGKLFVFDICGTEVNSFPIPLLDDVNELVSTLVRFDPNQPPFLITVISWKRWKRSLLCAHDAAGKLVYEEVLSELCSSVFGITEDNRGKESLLVGGAGRVLKYEALTS